MLNFALDSMLTRNREYGKGDDDNDMILINIRWFHGAKIFRGNVDNSGVPFFYLPLTHIHSY